MEQVHTIRKYEYYDRDTLCSIIDVDFTTKQVRVETKWILFWTPLSGSTRNPLGMIF